MNLRYMTTPSGSILPDFAILHQNNNFLAVELNDQYARRNLDADLAKNGSAIISLQDITHHVALSVLPCLSTSIHGISN
jgi:hypothetical protein